MWRFEKKFVLERASYIMFCKELHIKGYVKAFPDRIVNSIYFDDTLLRSYYENINGESNRTKYRLRFYGSQFSGKGVWEQKRKSVDLNHKITEEYKESYTIDKRLVFPNQEHLRPLIHVQYTREYFYSDRDQIRVTIDKEIRYINFNSKDVINENSLIVEYKCPQNILIKDVPSILSNLSRSSKYCKAISAHRLSAELY